jgi:histidyl-tRNA synthetase
VASGARAEVAALQLAERLRDALPRRGVQLNIGGGNFKAQFRRADRSGASLALVLGDEELARGVVAVKPLRREGGQTDCPLDEAAARIGALLAVELEAGSAASATGVRGSVIERG